MEEDPISDEEFVEPRLSQRAVPRLELGKALAPNAPTVQPRATKLFAEFNFTAKSGLKPASDIPSARPTMTGQQDQAITSSSMPPPAFPGQPRDRTAALQLLAARHQRQAPSTSGQGEPNTGSGMRGTREAGGTCAAGSMEECGDAGGSPGQATMPGSTGRRMQVVSLLSSDDEGDVAGAPGGARRCTGEEENGMGGENGDGDGEDAGAGAAVARKRTAHVLASPEDAGPDGAHDEAAAAKKPRMAPAVLSAAPRMAVGLPPTLQRRPPGAPLVMQPRLAGGPPMTLQPRLAGGAPATLAPRPTAGAPAPRPPPAPLARPRAPTPSNDEESGDAAVLGSPMPVDEPQAEGQGQQLKRLRRLEGLGSSSSLAGLPMQQPGQPKLRTGADVPGAEARTAQVWFWIYY